MPETVVEDGELWTIAVNRNQNLLGKAMLVLRRPCTAVSQLELDEWERRTPGLLTQLIDAARSRDHGRDEQGNLSGDQPGAIARRCPAGSLEDAGAGPSEYEPPEGGTMPAEGAVLHPMQVGGAARIWLAGSHLSRSVPCGGSRRCWRCAEAVQEG